MPRLSRFALLVPLALILAMFSGLPATAAEINGTIVRAEPGKLILRTRDGEKPLAYSPSTTLESRDPASVTEIKAGDLLRVAAKPDGDATKLIAQNIEILVPGRVTPFIDLKQGLYIGVVTPQASGYSLAVNGKTFALTIPADAPVIRRRTVTPDQLKPEVMVWGPFSSVGGVDTASRLVVTLPAAKGAGASATGAKGGSTLLLEVERFQFQGGWMVSSGEGAFGDKFLRTFSADTPVPDAITAINVPKAGTYHVWTRGKDYPENQPGMRSFTVLIDGVKADKESGKHGKAGFYWEKVKTMPLDAGKHIVSLNDSGHFFARCDAILLTTEELDPNKLDRNALSARRIEPFMTEVNAPDPLAAKIIPVVAQSGREVARLENASARVIFEEVTDSAGGKQIARRTEFLRNGQWETLPAAPGGEQLVLLYSAVNNFRASVFPHWDDPRHIREVEMAGRKVKITFDSENPFAAADATILQPRSAAPGSGAHSVVMNYAAAQGATTAQVTWTLAAAGFDLRCDVQVKAPVNGFYSIGYAAFQPWERSQVQFVELPPLLQFQRLPPRPQMTLSSLTPHPMALLEVKGTSGAPVSMAVVAEPAKLPFRWATVRNPVYGFSLLNSTAKAQPCIFAPVLGLEGSEWKAGETHTSSWRVLAMPGDWTAAMDYISTKIMGVTDYRQPVNASLTEASLNMMDLMMDGKASGWDDELKGFWNIEMKNSVTQAMPLAIISSALLTRDEKLYAERALPTIAFNISRESAHFGRPGASEQNTKNLAWISKFYGTSYWEGLHHLLNGLNPWIAEVAAPNGQPLHATAYNNSAPWSELLAVYRLKPTPALLAQIRGEADAFIDKQFHGRSTEPIDFQQFYNIHFYPYWWDLMELYELTQDAKYLHAAEEGAFHTIAGLWAQPLGPQGNVTIHPKGVMNGSINEVPWYYGENKYRRGWPIKPGAITEHEVPGWQTSPVGFGLEQPSTYFNGDGGPMRNVQICNWSAHLTRVHQFTGRDIYNTYARNSIIGRFTNYPGYYITDFTDLVVDKNYIYNGPDMTSFYFHHIPVQLGATLDFLVATAADRTQGKIKFPHVVQKNYAYFMNYAYGVQPGEIFGETGASLWLDHKLAQFDTPDIDWLAARSHDRFWLILMNQRHETVNFKAKLDKALIGLKSGEPCTHYAADGTRTEAVVAETMTTSLPAQGIMVYSMPAEPRDLLPAAIPALQAKPITQAAGADWGDMHAVRIRSPFGKDALYVYVTGGPATGGKATLNVAGLATQPAARSRFPYEFIVYPLPLAQNADFTLKLETPTGAAKSLQGTLAGN